MEKQEHNNNIRIQETRPYYPWYDWVTFTTLTILLRFISYIFIPVSLLLPAPIFILYLRKGLKEALSSLGAVLVFLFIFDINFDIYILQLILIGSISLLLLGKMLKVNKKPISVLTLIILVPLILVPAVIMTSDYLFEGTTEKAVEKSFIELEKHVEETKNYQESKESNKMMMENVLESTRWFMMNLYPFIYSVMIVLSVLITLFLVKKFSINLIARKFEIFKFSEIELPEFLLIFFVLSGLGVVLVKDFYLFIANNLLSYTLFFYFMLGFAILYFIFEIFEITHGVRIILIIGMFLIPFLPILLIGIGMLNSRIPLREKIKEYKEKISNSVE